MHAPNDPALVDAILTELGVDPDYGVIGRDEPLGILLADHLEIRTPSRMLQALVGSRTRNADAAAALGGETEHSITTPGSWLYGKDALDLMRLAELTVDEFVDTLRPLAFRDYSIASSPVVHPDRMHLTAASGMPARRAGTAASPRRSSPSAARTCGCT